MAIIRVKFLVAFQDLTIIPRKIKQYEELEVNDNEYARLVSSGAKMQMLGHVIPPSTSEPVESNKKAKKDAS